MTDGTPTGNRVSYYNRLLQSGPGSSFEAAAGSLPDLSGSAIENITVRTGAELRRIVQEESTSVAKRNESCWAWWTSSWPTAKRHSKFSATVTKLVCKIRPSRGRWRSSSAATAPALPS